MLTILEEECLRQTGAQPGEALYVVYKGKRGSAHLPNGVSLHITVGETCVTRTDPVAARPEPPRP